MHKYESDPFGFMYKGVFYLRNYFEKEKIILFLQVFMLFAGAFVGALYMALSSADSELYSYLMRFFQSLSEGIDKFSIFKNSLRDNLGIFIFILVCGMFRFGIIGSAAVCAAKGFVGGFTASAFVRYYGAKGMLVSLASFPASLIYLPTFIAFCSFSSCFSLLHDKKEKSKMGTYFLFSLICLTIFCVVSFFDGYVTTAFVKLLRPFIVNL